MLVSDKYSDVNCTCRSCGISKCYNWPVTDSAGSDHVIHRIRAILAGTEWLPGDKGRHRCVTAKFCVVDGEVHCGICRC